MGALDQEVSKELVSGLGDMELGFLRPGLVLPGPETEIGTDRPGSGEPAGIFYREFPPDQRKLIRTAESARNVGPRSVRILRAL